MKKFLGVLNSDAVNRYGMKFPIKVLEDCLSQSWQIGVPNNIGHDIHRPVGWVRPFGLYFEPGLTRFVGSILIPELEDEMEILFSTHQKYVTHFHIESCKPFKDVFTKILSEPLSGNETYLYTSCVSILDTGLAKKVFGDIFQRVDEDDLISMDVVLRYFDPIGPGEFKSKENELVLFVHPYFRKSLSRLNNFNDSFLKQFISLASEKDKKLNLKLSFDTDLVGYAPSYHKKIELEYWRGPKFNNEISKIPLGVTVHASNPDDYLKIFHGVSKTEFWWKSKKSKRSLEVEELKEIPSFGLGEDLFGCRYIHSFFDFKEKLYFEHFDGAIRTYTSQAMNDRLIVDIKSAGKRTKYTKLFKVDGELAIDLWKSLVTDYFQGNPMLIEYFGEHRENALEPTILNEVETKEVKEVLCPYSLDRGMGLRMMISYHPYVNDFGDEERSVLSFDTLTAEDKTYHILEHDTIELMKTINRLGGKMQIPPDINLIAYEDLYLNLPVIRHCKKHFPGNLQCTIKALELIANSFKKRNTNHVISFTMAWPTETKEVWLSVFGHEKDICRWFAEFPGSYPSSDDQISDWLEEVGKWLSDNYPISGDVPPLAHIVQPTGVIWFRRYILSDEVICRPYYSEEDRALMLELGIPKTDIRLIEALKNKQIQAIPAFFVHKTECSKCGDDYEKCPDSKYLDENVSQKMSKVELAFTFWSDKKA